LIARRVDGADTDEARLSSPRRVVRHDERERVGADRARPRRLGIVVGGAIGVRRHRRVRGLVDRGRPGDGERRPRRVGALEDDA